MFATVRTLIRHHKDHHPDAPEMVASNNTSAVLTYTKSLITNGLLRLGLLSAISTANGADVFSIYR